MAVGLYYLKFTQNHLIPHPNQLDLLILFIDDFHRFCYPIIIRAFLFHQVIDALWQL